MQVVESVGGNPNDAHVYVVPVQVADTPFHVSNLSIEEMFFTARNRYMTMLDVGDVWGGPVLPMIRELVTRFDAEVSQGDALVVVTHVVSRSARAFVMEQRLELETRVAATCRSVQVCVDGVAGGATTIPNDLWKAIVTMEGIDIASSYQPNG